jgi:hypothetical protein
MYVSIAIRQVVNVFFRVSGGVFAVNLVLMLKKILGDR